MTRTGFNRFCRQGLLLHTQQRLFQIIIGRLFTQPHITQRGIKIITLDGTDLEFTGVAPDIYIENTFSNKVAGEDPQLEKAVEVILNKLK